MKDAVRVQSLTDRLVEKNIQAKIGANQFMTLEMLSDLAQPSAPLEIKPNSSFILF